MKIASQMQNSFHPPYFLASVRSVAEAILAQRYGADIIDLKDPRRGAIGALSRLRQQQILLAMNEYQPQAAMFSIVLGLWRASDPYFSSKIIHAMQKTKKLCQQMSANSQVRWMKCAIAGSAPQITAALSHLQSLLGTAPLQPGKQPRSSATFQSAIFKIPQTKCILLFFADMLNDADDPASLVQAALKIKGVGGVMLDTANKNEGRLLDYLPSHWLKEFVRAAHSAGGIVGLAGALAVTDIAALKGLEADVLGFRGALCAGRRTAMLRADCVRKVRSELNKTHKQLSR